MMPTHRPWEDSTARDCSKQIISNLHAVRGQRVRVLLAQHARHHLQRPLLKIV
jgi:hypothetical protein